jgi:penicillin-binding protein 2
MKGLHSYRLRSRATLAQWGLVAVFAVLAGTFFRLQVVQFQRFQLRAEDNRIRSVPLKAPRGPILDRDGRIIAENVPGFAVKFLAPSEDSLRAVLARVQDIIPLDSLHLERVVQRYRRARHLPALVTADGSFEIISRLEEHRALLPGMVIESEPKRHYPHGAALAHVIGYVGEVNEDDLATGRFPGARLGTMVGRGGLEEEYDQVLRGRSGIRFIEVNAIGRLVREAGVAPTLLPTEGQPLHTTIDIDLQVFVDSLWRVRHPGRRGAVVALSLDGKVLASYSAPTYDPNLFIGRISENEWRLMVGDPAKPLFNRAIQARYPPASPFKLAVAAMGLKRGIVTPGSRMPQPCRGGLGLGNRFFRCWKREGHGALDLTGAIRESCDVYFYQLGARLGLNAILDEGLAMGFRERSGLDLQSEARSIYPYSTAYFDQIYGPRGWTAQGAEFNMAIGQGDNAQTLMNMVKFYQALAGDGSSDAPYLVQQRDDAGHDLGLTSAQLGALRAAMVEVVETGTAIASRRLDLAIAGKTGTAQNAHGEDHGWFIGFAPADNPQIIVGAIMEFAEHGSRVAPFVADVMSRFVLGPDAVVQRQFLMPADSAPRAVQIDPQAEVDPNPSPPPDSTYPIIPFVAPFPLP